MTQYRIQLIRNLKKNIKWIWQMVNHSNKKKFEFNWGWLYVLFIIGLFVSASIYEKKSDAEQKVIADAELKIILKDNEAAAETRKVAESKYIASIPGLKCAFKVHFQSEKPIEGLQESFIKEGMTQDQARILSNRYSRVVSVYVTGSANDFTAQYDTLGNGYYLANKRGYGNITEEQLSLLEPFAENCLKDAPESIKTTNQ